MIEELYARPLSRFLKVVARGSRNDRTALALLEEKEQRFFAFSLDAVATAAYGNAEPVRAHAAFFSVIRMVWMLAPLELFTQTTPNFRRLAADAIEQKLNIKIDAEEVADDLVVVFKRIRMFHRTGRRTTSFRPSDATQLEILRNQRWRCAACLFRFADDLDRYAAEEEDVTVATEPMLPGEVRLAVTYRRPELDHIIPHLLGGDSSDNWQILCRTCNQGKSDSIASIGRHFYTPSVREADFQELTASKRYATVAVARKSVVNLSLVSEAQHLRIFRRLSGGMLNVENLVALMS